MGGGQTGMVSSCDRLLFDLEIPSLDVGIENNFQDLFSAI